MKRLAALFITLITIPLAISVYADTFNDMADNEFKPYVEKLSEDGIINGDENGMFNPTSNVSRAEFSKMLVLAGKYDITERAAFGDVNKSDWFYDYVITLADRKIINGYDDGTFKPYGSITVEQAAKMLVCALEQKYDKIPVYGSAVATAFKDINDIGSWAKEYIFKAQMFGFLNRVRFNDEKATNILYNLKPQKELTRGEVAEIIYNFKNTEEVLAER